MTASSAFTPLGEGEFHASIGRTTGIAVVLFSTPHCGTCRTWKQLLPRALADSGARLYEVDVTQATGIARYYDIFHLPAIYLYRDGRFHAELQCEASPAAIRETSARLLAGPAQEEP